MELTPDELHMYFSYYYNKYSKIQNLIVTYKNGKIIDLHIAPKFRRIKREYIQEPIIDENGNYNFKNIFNIHSCKIKK